MRTVLNIVTIWLSACPVRIVPPRIVTPIPLTLSFMVVRSNPKVFIIFVFDQFGDKLVLFFWMDRHQISLFVDAIFFSLFPWLWYIILNIVTVLIMDKCFPYTALQHVCLTTNQIFVFITIFWCLPTKLQASSEKKVPGTMPGFLSLQLTSAET